MKKPHKRKHYSKKKVWKVFSQYIRLKYANEEGIVECYTCGIKKYWNEGMQAGHGFTGRGNSILFDERIVRPQCERCNWALEGNYDIFHQKLVEEYGPGILKEMNEQKKLKKEFSQEELDELYIHYGEEVVKLKAKIKGGKK